MRQDLPLRDGIVATVRQLGSKRYLGIIVRVLQALIRIRHHQPERQSNDSVCNVGMLAGRWHENYLQESWQFHLRAMQHFA